MISNNRKQLHLGRQTALNHFLLTCGHQKANGYWYTERHKIQLNGNCRSHSSTKPAIPALLSSLHQVNYHGVRAMNLTAMYLLCRCMCRVDVSSATWERSCEPGFTHGPSYCAQRKMLLPLRTIYLNMKMHQQLQSGQMPSCFCN